MKNVLLITALTLPIGIFAQGPNVNINLPVQSQMQNTNYFNQIDINNDNNPIQTNLGNQQMNPSAQVKQQSTGNIFGSEENNKSKTTECKDCDAVKKALKASYASSSGTRHNKSYSIQQWSRMMEGKINIKMKKVFGRRYKSKTSYAVCFNWH